MNVPDIIILREMDQTLKGSVRSLRTSALGVAFECLHLCHAHPVYILSLANQSRNETVLLTQ